MLEIGVINMKYNRYNAIMEGGIHYAPTTLCYKGNQLIKALRDVISVKPDKKYGYFIITQKIYHHEIISTIRFADCERIIYTDSKGIRREITPND